MDQDPATVCAELRTMREHCAPAERQVIDNLLTNRDTARGAFAEILTRNPTDAAILDGPQRWQRLIDAIVQTAAALSPARIEKMRSATERVEEITEEIAEKARAIAKLLRTRAELCDQFNLTRPQDTHPLDVINEAANMNSNPHTAGLYRLEVAPRLAELDEQLDLRYWPPMADCLDALAQLQHTDLVDGSADIHPHASAHEDDAAYAAMNTRQKKTVRAFWRALHAQFERLSDRHDVDVSLSADTVVAITIAALVPTPRGADVDNYRHWIASIRNKSKTTR